MSAQERSRQLQTEIEEANAYCLEIASLTKDVFPKETNQLEMLRKQILQTSIHILGTSRLDNLQVGELRTLLQDVQVQAHTLERNWLRHTSSLGSDGHEAKTSSSRFSLLKVPTGESSSSSSSQPVSKQIALPEPSPVQNDESSAGSKYEKQTGLQDMRMWMVFGVGAMVWMTNTSVEWKCIGYGCCMLSLLYLLIQS